MEKLKMRVHFGIALNHPLDDDFFEANFLLKGDYSGKEDTLRKMEYYHLSINYDGYQYCKCAHLIQNNDRKGRKAIDLNEDYLNEIFEMAEHDVKALGAEFEDIDVYNASKEKMKAVIKLLKGDSNVPNEESINS
jgi:hypothetical protein